MSKKGRDKESTLPFILVFAENGKLGMAHLSPLLMFHLALPLHSPMMVKILIIEFNITKHTIKLTHA